MSEEMDPKKMVERYMEQMLHLAAEAGHMLDKTWNIMETSSKEMIGAISRETKTNAQEIKRLTSEIMGDVKQDLPRIRAELKEMEARAWEKLREFEGK